MPERYKRVLVGWQSVSVSRTEPVFEPSPEWEKADLRILLWFGHFLSSYRVNIASCNLCARAKVPGHRQLKIEQNPSLVKLVKGF